MEGPQAAAGGVVSLHNFSARLWEQLVHFHVMRLTDSLFLWVGATPHLRNLAVAMCSRYVSTGPGLGYWEGGAGRGETVARNTVGCAVRRRPGQCGLAVGVWALAGASRRAAGARWRDHRLGSARCAGVALRSFGPRGSLELSRKLPMTC